MGEWCKFPCLGKGSARAVELLEALPTIDFYIAGSPDRDLMICKGAKCDCTVQPLHNSWYAPVEGHDEVHPHMLDRNSAVWLGLMASPSADWQIVDSLYCCGSSPCMCPFKTDTLIEIDMK